MVLEIYSFLRVCPVFFFIQIDYSILLWLFIFLLSFFILFGSFFLLHEPGQRFLDFVYPFKEAVLGFIGDFFLFFFLDVYFVYFISALNYFLASSDFTFGLFFFF